MADSAGMPSPAPDAKPLPSDLRLRRAQRELYHNAFQRSEDLAAYELNRQLYTREVKSRESARVPPSPCLWKAYVHNRDEYPLLEGYTRAPEERFGTWSRVVSAKASTRLHAPLQLSLSSLPSSDGSDAEPRCAEDRDAGHDTLRGRDAACSPHSEEQSREALGAAAGTGTRAAAGPGKGAAPWLAYPTEADRWLEAGDSAGAILPFKSRVIASPAQEGWLDTHGPGFGRVDIAKSSMPGVPVSMGDKEGKQVSAPPRCRSPSARIPTTASLPIAAFLPPSRGVDDRFVEAYLAALGAGEEARAKPHSAHPSSRPKSPQPPPQPTLPRAAPPTAPPTPPPKVASPKASASKPLSPSKPSSPLASYKHPPPPSQGPASPKPPSPAKFSPPPKIPPPPKSAPPPKMSPPPKVPPPPKMSPPPKVPPPPKMSLPPKVPPPPKMSPPPKVPPPPKLAAPPKISSPPRLPPSPKMSPSPKASPPPKITAPPKRPKATRVRFRGIKAHLPTSRSQDSMGGASMALGHVLEESGSDSFRSADITSLIHGPDDGYSNSARDTAGSVANGNGAQDDQSAQAAGAAGAADAASAVPPGSFWAEYFRKKAELEALKDREPFLTPSAPLVFANHNYVTNQTTRQATRIILDRARSIVFRKWHVAVERVIKAHRLMLRMRTMTDLMVSALQELSAKSAPSRVTVAIVTALLFVCDYSRTCQLLPEGALPANYMVTWPKLRKMLRKPKGGVRGNGILTKMINMQKLASIQMPAFEDMPGLEEMSSSLEMLASLQDRLDVADTMLEQEVSRADVARSTEPEKLLYSWLTVLRSLDAVLRPPPRSDTPDTTVSSGSQQTGLSIVDEAGLVDAQTGASRQATPSPTPIGLWSDGVTP